LPLGGGATARDRPAAASCRRRVSAASCRGPGHGGPSLGRRTAAVLGRGEAGYAGQGGAGRKPARSRHDARARPQRHRACQRRTGPSPSAPANINHAGAPRSLSFHPQPNSAGSAATHRLSCLRRRTEPPRVLLGGAGSRGGAGCPDQHRPGMGQAQENDPAAGVPGTPGATAAGAGPRRVAQGPPRRRAGRGTDRGRRRYHALESGGPSTRRFPRRNPWRGYGKADWPASIRLRICSRRRSAR
jgi:hypothetical protein